MNRSQMIREIEAILRAYPNESDWAKACFIVAKFEDAVAAQASQKAREDLWEGP